MPASSVSSTGSARHAWAYASLAGVLVGAAFTLSPSTLWFLLLLPVLFGWAQRDLWPRERRWVLGLLGLAVVSRLLALSAFFLTADAFNEPYAVLIGDERFILNQSMWMVELARGHRLDALNYVDRFGPYGRSGLQPLLAYWQLWFGAAPYGAHLQSVAMWLGGAIALHRTARHAFGPLAALAGLSVVLFMPTLFVWSISALKEPACFFLTAMTIVGAMAVVRGRHLATRSAAGLLALGAMAGITTLRTVAVVATAGGLVLAAAAWLATRRAWTGVALVVLIFVGSLWAVRQPTVEARLMRGFRLAAITHLGNVNTPGHGYKLLEPHFYTRVQDHALSYMGHADAQRFAVRAAASFLVVPLPWEAGSRSALVLLPEQLAWYVLAALACVGMAAGWRRDAVFTAVLMGNALIAAAVIALSNGNVGTLVRMRDTVVPVVVWLSAVGGCALLERAVRRFSEGPAYGAI